MIDENFNAVFYNDEVMGIIEANVNEFIAGKEGSLQSLSKDIDNVIRTTIEQLKKEAALEAKPILKENMINYIAALEDGKDIGINEAAIKSIYGEKVFSDFKETQNNTKKVSVFKTAIFNSKIGDEQNILNMFELKSVKQLDKGQYSNSLSEVVGEQDSPPFC